MKNKFFYIFILILIIIPYIFPIISSANYNNYIALGDSISQGFTMLYGVLEEDNYPQQLREKLGISQEDFKNLSIPSETTKTFYTTIQTPEYTNAITNADLITITIGSNEIIQIISEAFSSATGIEVTNDMEFVDKVYKYCLDADLTTKFEILLDLYKFFTTEDINGKVGNYIAVYEEYWQKSINFIKDINPDATIVATEFYNPYQGVTLINYDFGGWVDDIIQKLNNILHTNSNSETIYKIAKIYSPFNNITPRLTYVNISLTNFNIDPHPNKLGHEIISSKISEALTSITPSQKTKDISLATINNIVDQEYTGEAIEPQIIVKNGDYVLVKNKDYITYYINNINVGEASIVIVGIGNYKGTITKTFNIRNTSTKDISTCTVNKVDSLIYLGMNLEPDITIMDGNKSLVKNQDYTLKYSNNLNSGIATVTINGIGNYTGAVTTNFIILPNTISLATIQNIPDQLYSGEELTPEVLVTYVANKLLENKDYTVTYKDNIDVGTATVTITGIGNFSGNITKEFNILDNVTSQLEDISQATVSQIPQKTYSGNPITPEIEITLEGNRLIKNIDYKIFYSNNIDVGTGLITVVGIGEYTGILETNFGISPKSIENLSLKDIPNQEYTGKNIKPDLVLTDSSKRLKLNNDYTVKYTDNTEIGTATIEITGKGNYIGTITKTFNIVEPKQDDDGDNNDAQKPPTNTDEKKDPTISPETIPNAGIGLKLFLTLMLFSVLSFILYRLYKKW